MHPDGKFPAGWGGLTSGDGIDQPAVPPELACGPSPELVEALTGKLDEFRGKLRELRAARADAAKQIDAILSYMDLAKTAIETLLPVITAVVARQLTQGDTEDPTPPPPAEPVE